MGYCDHIGPPRPDREKFWIPPHGIQWDGHFYQNNAGGKPNVYRNVNFVNYDGKCMSQEHGLVDMFAIIAIPWSVNSQEWVGSQTFDNVRLFKTQRLMHFDPLT